MAVMSTDVNSCSGNDSNGDSGLAVAAQYAKSERKHVALYYAFCNLPQKTFTRLMIPPPITQQSAMHICIVQG